jgi:hypothetical protein
MASAARAGASCSTTSATPLSHSSRPDTWPRRVATRPSSSIRTPTHFCSLVSTNRVACPKVCSSQPVVTTARPMAYSPLGLGCVCLPLVPRTRVRRHGTSSSTPPRWSPMLDPDVLFPLADAVSVRRDRAFIEAEYAGQQFPDGTPVRFPTPRLTTRRYDLDTAHPGLLRPRRLDLESRRRSRPRPRTTRRVRDPGHQRDRRLGPATALRRNQAQRLRA